MNALLSQNEQQQKDLYAAIRQDHPPIVGTTRIEPYQKLAPKEKPKVTTRRVNTRKHLEEVNQPVSTQPIIPQQNYTQPQIQDDIQMNTELPIIGTKPKPRALRTKRAPLKINYDIGSDVLDQKANISVRDLITISPAMRRELTKECRPKRKTSTMAFIEDNDESTTAVYTQLCIGDKQIRTLIDCGAAKTCMSKALAEALGLSIDASSASIFTLGNTTKQPALGLIYDVPIEVQDDLIIPCTVEVLPICPTHLIIGNNWLSRSKAKIDFNSSTMQVTYKDKKAEIDISFVRKTALPPKMRSQEITYKKPVSITNTNTKQVHFEDVTTTEEEPEESYDASESSNDTDEESEEETETLLVLDDKEIQETSIIQQKEEYLIQATDQGLVIPAHASSTFTIQKDKNEKQNQKDYVYHFETTNPKLEKAQGFFDHCAEVVVNRKSIVIHLYNRTRQDIALLPQEDIGVLEKFDLRNEDIIQAYQMNREHDLFALQESDPDNPKNEQLEDELYNKLEVGEIEKELKEKLKTLLHKYRDIFDWNNDTIGRTNLLTHKIVIQENTMPISHRPYRLSPIEADHLQKELDKYCKLGIITPSNSPWAAPVILVKKKNGEFRMVIDYRKLNAITKKDSYPLPRIDDLLDTLGKAKIFSALDMRAGFHQVPMDEESKELTAFTTKYGTYHYNTLPMGLVNSPATFQRLIDLCFRRLISNCLVAYIDDLNIYSLDRNEHLQHLDQVFNCIQIANLKLNPEKCFFFKDHLKFLGYIITKEGIETDPVKVQKIQEYPVPTTKTQMRGFLGLASYYRRFIKNFATIARPLHDQTKSTKQIPWTQKTTNSFETLKNLLTTAPILSRPDFNKPFILVTDASKQGLGCILTQLDENGHEHPVIYASRSLKSSEVNYAATKLECLAVVWAVKLFRPYLLGRKFQIITDHSALSGLLKTTNPTGIIARWITIISEYEFEIKYRPGRVNESADFMSRLGY